MTRAELEATFVAHVRAAARQTAMPPMGPHALWFRPDGWLHGNEYDRTLATAILEIRVCVAHGWPWTHALTQPFLSYFDGSEFVGAQGGLTWDPQREEWT